MANDLLAPRSFDQVDDGDDRLFYAPARLVTPIDEAAVAARSSFLGELLDPGAAVRDLMSRPVSHLASDPQLGEVVGHGMNAQELSANPRLARGWVHLNVDRAPPLADGSAGDRLVVVTSRA